MRTCEIPLFSPLIKALFETNFAWLPSLGIVMSRSAFPAQQLGSHCIGILLGLAYQRTLSVEPHHYLKDVEKHHSPTKKCSETFTLFTPLSTYRLFIISNIYLTPIENMNLVKGKLPSIYLDLLNFNYNHIQPLSESLQKLFITMFSLYLMYLILTLLHPFHCNRRDVVFRRIARHDRFTCKFILFVHH